MRQFIPFVIALASFLLSQKALCQTFSLGAKIGLNGYNNSGQTVVAGPFAIVTHSDAGFDDVAYHLFGRCDWRFFYLQAELRYSKPAIGYSLHNVDPDNPAYSEFRRLSLLSYSEGSRTYDFPITAGVKVLRHFRLYGGLTPSFGSSPPLKSPYMDGTEIDVVNAITHSYRRTQLYGAVGVGLDLGRFSLDYTYESSLTPVSKTLVWRNQSQPFRRTSVRTFINIGYRFYPWPSFKRK